MLKGLFVSHSGERCGVYQFGRRLFDALRRGDGQSKSHIDWIYAQCDCAEDFETIARSLRPEVALFNFHPLTLPWATSRRWNEVVDTSFAIYHEIYQEAADSLSPAPFDFMLCPDPTLMPRNPTAIPVPRFIPDRFMGASKSPQRFTIGSFGFATPNKGFDRMCQLINDQFEEAVIRINLPPHDSADLIPQAAVRHVEHACRNAISKPGIELVLTNRFMDDFELVEFLASNTINVFMYDSSNNRGLSSCIDYALASGRPLGVSKSMMFRHIHDINPSICVEDRTLSEIAADGVCSITHLVAKYSASSSGAAWNSAMLAARKQLLESKTLPDGRGYNKIMSDHSAQIYRAIVSQLTPPPGAEDTANHTADAIHAFLVDTTRRLITHLEAPKILAVSEGNARWVTTLRELGYRIDHVSIDRDAAQLHKLYYAGGTVMQCYDLVLFGSPFRGQQDDKNLIRMIGDLTAPGGIVVFLAQIRTESSESSQHSTKCNEGYYSWDVFDYFLRTLRDFGFIDSPIDEIDIFDPKWEYYNDAFAPFASVVLRKFNLEGLRLALSDLQRSHNRGWATPVSLEQTNYDLLRTYGKTYYSMLSHFRCEQNESREKLFRSDGIHEDFLVFGPYVPVRKGRYKATILLCLDEFTPDLGSKVLGKLDVVGDGVELGHSRLIYQEELTAGAYLPVFLSFSAERDIAAWELRFLVNKLGRASAVSAVALRRADFT